MSSNKMATKADLQEMYSRILPYLGGSADAGFTPVGTIISVMGVTAPANYLACNGQVVNIADYPELANYFYQQFGSKNKFGGNGTTTFGIPDLRGEFLRGTGTNAHTNQGNGSAVGTHQDATIIPYLVSWHGSTPQSGIMGASESDLDVKNPDKAWKRSSGTLAWAKASSFTSGTTGMTNDSFITRPTNTSILFCIATKNIYMNPSLDYSTDEKVVGTWVNGKTIYQRTFNELQNAQATTQGSPTSVSYDIGAQVDTFVSIDTIRNTGTSAEVSCDPIYISCALNNGSLVTRLMFVYGTTNSFTSNPNKIIIQNSDPNWNNQLFTVTIRYTKV